MEAHLLQLCSCSRPSRWLRRESWHLKCINIILSTACPLLKVSLSPLSQLQLSFYPSFKMQEQEKSELITCRAKVFPLLHLPWTRITAFAAVQEFKFQLFNSFLTYYHWKRLFCLPWLPPACWHTLMFYGCWDRSQCGWATNRHLWVV